MPRIAFKLLTDERLARLAADGDRAAFGAIYERHHQALYRYCRSITRDAEDASDALQDTMASALRGLEGDHREFALKPWLFRIAHNESVSLLRRRRAPAELSEQTTPTVAGPEVTYAQRERLKVLLDDVASLPYRQRGALVMRELSGLEYRRIATVFGVSEGAVRQLVHEARGSLHELAGGRDLRCESVVRQIAEGDGRALRGRKLRAHLRACDGCRDFQRHNSERAADLRALVPPMPAALAAVALSGIGAGAGGAGGTGGGLAAVLAGGAGQAAGGSLAAKGAVVAVVALAAGVGVVEQAIDPGRESRDRNAQQADGDRRAGERNGTSPARADARGGGSDDAAKPGVRVRGRDGRDRARGDGRRGGGAKPGGRGDPDVTAPGIRGGGNGDTAPDGGQGAPPTQAPSAPEQVAQAPAPSTGGGGGAGGDSAQSPGYQGYSQGMQAGQQAIDQAQQLVSGILGGFQPPR